MTTIAAFSSCHLGATSKTAAQMGHLDKVAVLFYLRDGRVGLIHRIADGLLLFYHERESGQYTIHVALLDDESGRVKSLLPEPIMRPTLTWEPNGDVDNVVYVQNAVPQPDGTIYLSYGASDRHVGAATVETTALLTALRAA